MSVSNDTSGLSLSHREIKVYLAVYANLLVY